MNQMADLVQKFSDELRSGLRPAYDNFIGFFHAIDWKVRLCFFFSSLFGFLENEKSERKLFQYLYLCVRFLRHYFGFLQEPWLIGLMGFYVVLLLITITSRRNINFQMSLFFLACKFSYSFRSCPKFPFSFLMNFKIASFNHASSCSIFFLLSLWLILEARFLFSLFRWN